MELNSFFTRLNELKTSAKDSKINDLLWYLHKIALQINSTDEKTEAIKKLIDFIDCLNDLDVQNLITSQTLSNTESISPLVKIIKENREYIKTVRIQEIKQQIENNSVNCQKIYTEEEEEKNFRKFQTFFREKGCSVAEIGRVIGLASSAMSLKLRKNKSVFRDYEIKQIIEYLNLTPEEVYYLFFMD